MGKQLYYCKIRGKSYGPLSPGQVRSLAAQGQLTLQDQIRAIDGSEWVSAEHVRGLFPAAVEPLHDDTQASIHSTQTCTQGGRREDISSTVTESRPSNGRGKLQNSEAPPIIQVRHARYSSPTPGRRKRLVATLVTILAAIILPYYLLSNQSQSRWDRAESAENEVKPPPAAQPNATDSRAQAEHATLDAEHPSSPSDQDTAVSLSDALIADQSEVTNRRLAATEKFLQTYWELRRSPQLKLLDYRDGPLVRWRCYVHATSDTGLGWVFGHLPSSDPDELELMVTLRDPEQEGRILDRLLGRRTQSAETWLEAIVSGRVVSFAPRSATPNQRPRVTLAESNVELVDHRTAGATTGSDIRDAETFLRAWRQIDTKDPSGDDWLNNQLIRRGYLSNRRIEFWCRLDERTDSGDFRGVIRSQSIGDLPVRIMPRDSASAAAAGWDYPKEMIVGGRIAMVSHGMLYIQDAHLEPFDARVTAASDGEDAHNVSHSNETQLKADDVQSFRPNHTVSENNASGGLAELLIEFSKTTSLHYTNHGFDGLKFGELQEVVIRKSPGELYPVTYGAYFGFVHDIVSERRLFFEDGKLRAIVNDYDQDAAAATQLVRTFGKPRKEDVYETRGFDDRSQTAFQRLDVYYNFPQSIACVSAIALLSPNGPAEFTTVCVIDKYWLLEVVNDYAKQLDARLRWIATHTKSERVSLAQTPAIEGVRRIISPLGERHELKTNITGSISEAVIYESTDGPFLMLERFKHDAPANHLAPASGSRRWWLNTNALPEYATPILSGGTLSHLRCLLHVRLARRYFAPKGGEVLKSKNPSTGFEWYHWTSLGDWDVEVGPNCIEFRKQVSRH